MLAILFVCISLIVPKWYFAPRYTFRSLPPPKHGGVYVIAHRGAHLTVPENTLAAYEKAADMGVDFVEIDTRVTKDGHIISMHNDHIDAYTQGKVKGPVKDFTLAQIESLDIGSRMGPQWKNVRVPTIDQILDLCQNRVGIYVDEKAAPLGVLVQKIRAHHMMHDVVWYPNNISQMDSLHAYYPDSHPMPDPRPTCRLDTMIASWHPPIIATAWELMSPKFAAKIHKAGALIFCDAEGKDEDPARWQRLLDLGVDGIQTDHPAQLIKYLEAHPRQKHSP